MLGEITLNGISSRDFNVYLTDAEAYGMPERDVKSIEIDGRNGNLIIDNGRYKNRDISYPCVIIDNFMENYSAFLGYILNQRGYIRIESSFNPDEYVLGVFKNKTDVTTTTFREKGRFNIEFERKPQRFIKEGEFPIEFNSSGTIFNPYNGNARPLVRVYGTGSISIGDITITINSVNQYVDIDCEIQDAYKDTTNCNGNITLNNSKFFELEPGNNNISISGNISKIEIIPRWWRL